MNTTAISQFIPVLMFIVTRRYKMLVRQPPAVREKIKENNIKFATEDRLA